MSSSGFGGCSGFSCTRSVSVISAACIGSTGTGERDAGLAATA
ncbi:MAG: hypothetical protein U1F18_08360 [Steroidobacteraceae bacterium]